MTYQLSPRLPGVRYYPLDIKPEGPTLTAHNRSTEARPYSAAGAPRLTNGSLATLRIRSSASLASRWRFHIWA
jgi:hypothetical protein